MGERSLVHQIIRGINPNYSVLKSLYHFFRCSRPSSTLATTCSVKRPRAPVSSSKPLNPPSSPLVPPRRLPIQPPTTTPHSVWSQLIARSPCLTVSTVVADADVVVDTVVTVAAMVVVDVATIKTCSGKTWVPGACLGVDLGVRPGLEPLVWASSALVLRAMVVRPTLCSSSHTQCRHQCILLHGTPAASSKHFMPPHYSRLMILISGSWIQAHSLT